MKSFLKVLSSWRCGNLLEFPSLPADLTPASSSLWECWLHSAQDTAMTLYFIISGLKPAGSWIWSFACQSLVVSANCHLVWAPVCQVSSGRSRHQGGRGGRVFLPWNRASWLSAGYSNPTRSQPNIIQSLRPHLKMFHHHSESKQGLAEPREGKWRKVELWTPSGFSCWCFCIITMLRVRLGARMSLPCMLFSQHHSLSSVDILAEELLQKLQILQHK